jgi:hypothetical protein
VAQGSGSFHRLILYVTMVSRDGWPFPRHVAIATSIGIDKTSPQRHPRRPSLLLLYKRAGQGSTKKEEGRSQEQASKGRRTTNHRQRKTNLLLYSHFSFETWAWFPLSQLVTPTQALRCKEIQFSPSMLDVGPFFARTRIKPPCILLASPSRSGTRSI